MTEQRSPENDARLDAECGEDFYTYHSQWSVPRFCHRPAGHKGEHCGPGNGREHLHNCTDALVEQTRPIPPGEWVHRCTYDDIVKLPADHPCAECGRVFSPERSQP